MRNPKNEIIHALISHCEYNLKEIAAEHSDLEKIASIMIDCFVHTLASDRDADEMLDLLVGEIRNHYESTYEMT